MKTNLSPAHWTRLLSVEPCDETLFTENVFTVEQGWTEKINKMSVLFFKSGVAVADHCLTNDYQRVLKLSKFFCTNLWKSS